MTEQDREYYESLLDLFLHPGWKHIRQDVSDALDLAKRTATDLKTSDEFFVRKGNVQSLSWIDNFEKITKHNYEVITSEESK